MKKFARISIIFFSKLSLFFLILLLSISCTESSSSEGDASSSGETSGSGTLRTDCGTVVGGGVKNPIDGGDGVEVRIVRAAGPSTVVVTRAGGDQIIKLRALSENVSGFKASRALNVINDFRGSALLVTDECATSVSGGGRGVVGDLFNRRGVSLSEEIVNAGGAEIDANEGCGAELVGGCYQSLSDSSEPETGRSISNFLWKPISERDGRLVILLNPGGATVVVNGITLDSSGSSNGRGTTARADRSGGAFGSNITVEAFDSRGRVLVFPGGATSFNIPNGSQRVEF